CPSCQFNILESNFGRVGKGLFFEVALIFTLDYKNRSATLSKELGGASHEALWKHFHDLLKSVKNLLEGSLVADEKKTEAQKDIDFLISALAINVNGENKLSETRNLIQYQQKMGVWHPYSNKSDIKTLKRNVERSLFQNNDLRQFETNHHINFIRFVERCLLISYVGRSIIANLNQVYGPSFLSDGFLKYDRTLAKGR
ncbi:MAG: hypothetical protein V7679_11040, partial [Parasphingorhabdus sp.]